MTGDSRRERLARAGRWLREARQLRGIPTAVEFARRLGVDKALVSNYERGVNAVDDERAERIAEVLKMDVIDVRRNLGLWVPPDKPPRPAANRRDELLAQMRTDPEFRAEVGRVVVDALQSMAGSGHDDESTETPDDEQRGHKAS